MKGIIFIVIALIALAAGYGLYLYNKKPVDTREERADFELSAAELVRAFSGNEELATKQYANKILLVTGKIKEIDKSAATVILDSTDDMSSVTCSFYADEASTLDAIKIGSTVRIKGLCTGRLMDVVLNQCSLKVD